MATECVKVAVEVARSVAGAIAGPKSSRAAKRAGPPGFLIRRPRFQPWTACDERTALAVCGGFMNVVREVLHCVQDDVGWGAVDVDG
jgi:hypothetical protein